MLDVHPVKLRFSSIGAFWSEVLNRSFLVMKGMIRA